MLRHTLQTGVREPFVGAFLLIGACIHRAYGIFGTQKEDARDTTIHVDGHRIEAFIRQWKRRWHRTPTREEIDSLILRESSTVVSFLFNMTVVSGFLSRVQSVNIVSQIWCKYTDLP